MSGTYTPIRGLYKPAHGETGWDAKVNANFDNLDNAAASGAGGAVQSVSAVISSAQILDTNNPVVIVPAPGPGKWFNIINVTFEYIAGTVPYGDAGGAFFSVGWDNIVFATVDLSTPFANDLTSSIAGNCISAGAGGGNFTTALAAVVNKPISYQTSGAGALNGDGTLKVSVQYTIETA